MSRMTGRIVTLTLAATLNLSPWAEAEAPPSEGDLAEIAVEAYAYAYPLVLMDVSRRVMTNHEAPDPATGMGAPVNQFAHKRTFPDASFTEVVRPNADTLYSSLWFDVTAEPLVIRVPGSGGRYYLLPMLDMWTDIFASPGKRTTGTGAQSIAIVGPRWKGAIPEGVEVLRSPTGSGWVIGRTQTNGAADYGVVHKFQDGLTATPLSSWGKPYTPPRGKVDPSIPAAAPSDIVARMDAATFFSRFAGLMKENPPHANDYPMLARIRHLGIEPGRSFDFGRATPAVRRALEASVVAGPAKIRAYAAHSDPQVNGWGMIMEPVGTYGTAYLKRALIAAMGLGANVVEDAVYPFAQGMADGTPFDSGRKYTLRFAKDQIPPVRAFWSLTMYDDRQLFAANPIHRFAIGDRDDLKFGEDGSLTLYVQRESPGKAREANWLPAPAAGGFTLNLRLYWPRPQVLDGTWQPPKVERVGD